MFKTFQALMVLLKGKQLNWELIRQSINNSLNKDLDEFNEGKSIKESNLNLIKQLLSDVNADQLQSNTLTDVYNFVSQVVSK